MPHGKHSNGWKKRRAQMSRPRDANRFTPVVTLASEITSIVPRRSRATSTHAPHSSPAISLTSADSVRVSPQSPKGLTTTSRCAVLGLLSAVIGASILVLAPSSAQAETRQEYVNRYVLLTDWINRSEIWVAGRIQDPGLCRVAHAIAERHVELARRMTPPPEFISIHPHLLLVMENAERMFDYASNGERSAFHRHRRIVHEEQRIIAELLQAEGHFMPVIAP